MRARMTQFRATTAMENLDVAEPLQDNELTE
jgi:hypothetical protein